MNMGKGQQSPGQGVFVDQGPVVMEVFGVIQGTLPEPPQGLLHGIEGISFAGQDAEFNDFVKGLGQAFRGRNGDLPKLPPGEDFPDRHPVLGQGSGLIHAKDGGRPQGFHRGNPAGQNLVFGDPPGAQGQENGQDHREFLRHHGHGQSDSSQEAMEPVSQIDAVDYHYQNAKRHAEDRYCAHKLSRLFLQEGFFRLDRLQRFSNPPDFRGRTCGYNPGDSISLDDHSP